MHRVRSENTQAGLTWAFTVLQFMLFFSLAGNYTGTKHAHIGTYYLGTYMMLWSLGWVIFGVAFLLSNVVAQASLKTEEQFLRLELRIAELAGKQDTEQGS